MRVEGVTFQGDEQEVLVFGACRLDLRVFVDRHAGVVGEPCGLHSCSQVCGVVVGVSGAVLAGEPDDLLGVDRNHTSRFHDADEFGAEEVPLEPVFVVSSHVAHVSGFAGVREQIGERWREHGEVDGVFGHGWHVRDAVRVDHCPPVTGFAGQLGLRQRHQFPFLGGVRGT